MLSSQLKEHPPQALYACHLECHSVFMGLSFLVFKRETKMLHKTPGIKYLKKSDQKVVLFKGKMLFKRL